MRKTNAKSRKTGSKTMSTRGNQMKLVSKRVSPVKKATVPEATFLGVVLTAHSGMCTLER